MENILEKYQKRRKILQDDSKPMLFSHVKVQYDPIRKAYALLSPEKILWPNDIALDILNLCNGKNTVAEISILLAKNYEAPREAVHDDVCQFLQEWLDQLLVTL